MRILLATAMIAVSLAGCLGGSDDDGPDLPAPYDGRTLIHLPDGGAIDVTIDIPEGASALTGFGSFEPTLGVTSSGALFMSNSEGFPVTSHSSIVHSVDKGVTWEDITPNIGPLTTPPTTFDPYVHVDQATDRIYNLDMEGLNCNYIQWSDDDGASFTGHPLGCGQPPVLDHPTLFTGPPRMGPTVGYDNVVYLCVNRIADSACAMSRDGGFVFSPFRPVFPDLTPDEGAVPALGCGGLTGHGTTDPDGRAYLGKNVCGTPKVAVSDDDGLTWEATAVSSEYGASGHDIEVATDAAGNVYALWRDDEYVLRLAASTDHGATWGPAVNVSAPGVATAVFPTIAGGDDGRLAIAYYGTPANDPIGLMPDTVVWTGYIAGILDATSQAPIIASVPIGNETDPMARGPCDDDNRCNGVGDFIDIVIDEEGRPWVAFIDVCQACSETSGNDAAIGRIGTFREGMALRGDRPLTPLAGLS